MSINKEKALKGTPKVSVVLSAYEHVQFIEECVESVLRQTYKDYEFIVGDDGSKDGTVEKLLQYEDRIDEIHLYDVNSGSVMNDLLLRAKGEYLALFDSDDVWEEDKLMKQVKILDENPDAAACFTWCELIDEEGKIVEKENPFIVQGRSKEEWMNYFFFNGNCFGHASALVRREEYIKFRTMGVNMFRQLPDFYTWIRMVQKREIVMLEEKLTRIRTVNKSGRVNASAATRDNLIRHFNEESYIWYKVFSEMDDEYFKEAFAERLIHNCPNDIEILCEKFFVLLSAKVEWCKIAAFFFYYDNYIEMRDVLREVYGFEVKDMHEIVAHAGPSAYLR